MRYNMRYFLITCEDHLNNRATFTLECKYLNRQEIINKFNIGVKYAVTILMIYEFKNREEYQAFCKE